MKKLTVMQKVIALQTARDNAQDPDFKLLWDQKLRQLIKLAEEGKISWHNIMIELNNND